MIAFCHSNSECLVAAVVVVHILVRIVFARVIFVEQANHFYLPYRRSQTHFIPFVPVSAVAVDDFQFDPDSNDGFCGYLVLA